MRRLNLELPDVIHDAILALKDMAGASTITEVIKRAVRLYAFVLEAKARGATFKVVETDGKETGIEFLM